MSSERDSPKTFLCPIALTNKKKLKQKRKTPYPGVSSSIPSSQDHKSLTSLSNSGIGGVNIKRRSPQATHSSPITAHCHPPPSTRTPNSSGPVSVGSGIKLVVKKAYTAKKQDELNVQAGEIVILHREPKSSEICNWYWVVNHLGLSGYVPSDLLQPLCHDTIPRKKIAPPQTASIHTTASSDLHSQSERHQDSLLHHHPGHTNNGNSQQRFQQHINNSGTTVEPAILNSHQELYTLNSKGHLGHFNGHNLNSLDTNEHVTNFPSLESDFSKPRRTNGSGQNIASSFDYPHHHHPILSSRRHGSHTMAPIRRSSIDHYCGLDSATSNGIHIDVQKRGSTMTNDVIGEMRHSPNRLTSRHHNHSLNCCGQPSATADNSQDISSHSNCAAPTNCHGCRMNETQNYPPPNVLLHNSQTCSKGGLKNENAANANMQCNNHIHSRVMNGRNDLLHGHNHMNFNVQNRGHLNNQDHIHTHSPHTHDNIQLHSQGHSYLNSQGHSNFHSRNPTGKTSMHSRYANGNGYANENSINYSRDSSKLPPSHSQRHHNYPVLAGDIHMHSNQNVSSSSSRTCSHQECNGHRRSFVDSKLLEHQQLSYENQRTHQTKINESASNKFLRQAINCESRVVGGEREDSSCHATCRCHVIFSSTQPPLVVNEPICPPAAIQSSENSHRGLTSCGCNNLNGCKEPIQIQGDHCHSTHHDHHCHSHHHVLCHNIPQTQAHDQDLSNRCVAPSVLIESPHSRHINSLDYLSSHSLNNGAMATAITEPFTRRKLGKYLVIYNFIRRDENDISVNRFEWVDVLNDSDPDWYYVQRKLDKDRGFVPAKFLCSLTKLNSVSAASTISITDTQQLTMIPTTLNSRARSRNANRNVNDERATLSTSKHNIYQNHPINYHNSLDNWQHEHNLAGNQLQSVEESDQIVESGFDLHRGIAKLSLRSDINKHTGYPLGVS